MKRTPSELAALARLLDEALELPIPQRELWIASLADEYAPLRDTLRGLLSREVGCETSEFAGLEHGIAGIVEESVRAVIANAGERAYSWEALAYAGLARVALARGEPAQALAASRRSLARLAQIQGLYDVRFHPQLWLILSDALLANGDAAGAREWAVKAREASLQYEDNPTSPAIVAADAALRRANANLKARG